MGEILIRRGTIEKAQVNDIALGNRWRKPSDEQVETMRKSLRENGLLMPLGVRLSDQVGMEGKADRSVWILVHGATRLAAAKLEGWKEIDGQTLDGSDIDFEKAELVENLRPA
jgi:ParB-like chromosome segregation protein Spo0J